MALTANMIFVNLPVRDLKQSRAFFEAVGFAFNDQYSDDTAACLVISEQIFAMLLTHEKYASFSTKEICDTARSGEVILALTAESRAQVDEIVDKVRQAGGKPAKEPLDYGFMYSWSFEDVDGHQWEVFFMDPNAAQQG
ncbi:VOC family protein [Paenibacillus sp. S-38]|uniref:VOC family protein n=1 Tax=Paenibacillus sp. S-38 TaxID=3416710 RepID=UPI003CEB90E1